MLAAHEIDCAIIARPPLCFIEGHPDVVRLFPDYVSMEEEYYRRTKVWPMMHMIVDASRDQRRVSVVGAQSLQRVPRIEAVRDLFGGDLFPYGIEENWPTCEPPWRL